MKRIGLLLIPLLLGACARQAYQIDGIFTADDGTPVWLIHVDAKDTLDQTVVHDGRFQFRGSVKEPFYAYVGNGKQRVHLILEPGRATVDIDERVSSGMPMEDRYMAFHRRFYRYSRDQRAEKTALADSVVLSNRDNLVGALALDPGRETDPCRALRRECHSAPDSLRPGRHHTPAGTPRRGNLCGSGGTSVRFPVPGVRIAKMTEINYIWH